LRYKAGHKLNKPGSGVSKLPQTKKKAAVKSVKPTTSSARKASVSGPAKRGGSVAAKTASQHKKQPVKTAAPKKSVVKAKSEAGRKKERSGKAAAKSPVAKPSTSQKSTSKTPPSKLNVKSATSKLGRTDEIKELKKTLQEPAVKSSPKPSGGAIDATDPGKTESAGGRPEKPVGDKRPSTPRLKKQNPGNVDPANQGLLKQGQKKRGWRDIEALTERARLKSLLADIWHEDIDLDSDIFGETDHSSGYYSDKEEPEVEVEAEEAEVWEEFEEEED
jgi:hypothetical protein